MNCNVIMDNFYANKWIWINVLFNNTFIKKYNQLPLKNTILLLYIGISGIIGLKAFRDCLTQTDRNYKKKYIQTLLIFYYLSIVAEFSSKYVFQF